MDNKHTKNTNKTDVDRNQTTEADLSVTIACYYYCVVTNDTAAKYNCILVFNDISFISNGNCRIAYYKTCCYFLIRITNG